MADTNNQNSFLDYAGLALFWNNVKQIIKDNELVTATAITDLDTRVDTKVDQDTYAMDKEYLEMRVNSAESLAQGAQQALAFDNYSALIQYLNPGMIANSGNVLKVGQNLYIKQLNVPDLWISAFRAPDELTEYTYTTDEAFLEYINNGGWVGCYQLSRLETTKVDLTNYATKSEVTAVDTKINNIPIEKGTGSNSVVQKGGCNSASGEFSFAEGAYTQATGSRSHAEGNGTIASGYTAHTEGTETKALGEGSHSEGKGIVSGNYIFSGPIDSNKRVYQVDHTAGLEIGDILIRESDNYAVYITAIDGKNITFNNTFGPIVNQQLKKITGSFGAFSHSEGNETITNEHAAHAEGYGTKAFGQNSHAEGEKSKSFGKDSHSEGSNTVAAGDNSHAEGALSTAGGPSSHAEGYETQANSSQSHAEGYRTIIDSDIEFGGMWIGPTASHAEGYLTKVKTQGPQGGFIANGQAAHVEGYMTEAHNLGEHAEGRFNLSHTVTPQDASNPTEIELSQSTLHSVGMGFPDSTEPDNPEKGNRMNAHEIMQDGKHYIFNIGGYDGTNPANSKDIATYLPNMVNITYKELVDLRDSGGLIPGQQYRITDYVTTTVQVDTRSAGHPFDIIVTALDVNKLSETAFAIQSARDTKGYFSNSKLAAWQLWYCLDNDTNRFDWADATNGKGVIYRLIDEYDNDCPYDFKNIQFKRYKVTGVSVGPGGSVDLKDSLIETFENSYISLQNSNYTIGNSELSFVVDGTDFKFLYTFSVYENNVFLDDSLIPFCRKNKMGTYYTDESETQSLNNNVFCDPDGQDTDNFFGNTFKENCYNNTCWGYVFYYNTFGNNYYYNTFGNYFQYNTFGNDCYKNTFGNNCGSNTFGNDCLSNTFGNYCYYNTFGNYCTYNTFGNECESNTFGNDCYKNTFGNNCTYNTFGNSCWSNTFGNYCYYNTFGNECQNIKIQKNYVRDIIVENGNQYINITSTQTTSPSKPLRNFTIAQGVNSTTTVKTISHNTTKDTFKTTYQPVNSVVVSI